MSNLQHTSATTPHRSLHSARSRSLVALAASGIAGLLLLWLFAQGGEQRALLQLPEADRAVLYQHTIDNLKRVCDPSARPSGLDEYCKQQAEFVLMFPECDAGCQALAKAHQGQPTR
jgi:cytochrome b pre-mRNA-processing protein 3